MVSSNVSKNGHAGLGDRVEHIGSSAQELFTEARAAVDDLSRTLDLRGRTQRNPFGMLAAAAGVGYVLGGGLFTAMTARLVRFGIRLAALPIVKQELMHFAESKFMGGSGEEQPSEPRSKASRESRE